MHLFVVDDAEDKRTYGEDGVIGKSATVPGKHDMKRRGSGPQGTHPRLALTRPPFPPLY